MCKKRTWAQAFIGIGIAASLGCAGAKGTVKVQSLVSWATIGQSRQLGGTDGGKGIVLEVREVGSGRVAYSRELPKDEAPHLILPLPDGQLLMASEQQIYLSSAVDKSPQALPAHWLEGLRVEQLLGTEQGSEAGSMSAYLAVASIRTGSQELWMLKLKKGQPESLQPSEGKAAWANRESFHRSLGVPSCRDHGKECLNVDTEKDGKAVKLVVDSDSSEPPLPISIETPGVLDARFASNGSNIVLLRLKP